MDMLRKWSENAQEMGQIRPRNMGQNRPRIRPGEDPQGVVPACVLRGKRVRLRPITPNRPNPPEPREPGRPTNHPAPETKSPLEGRCERLSLGLGLGFAPTGRTV